MSPPSSRLIVLSAPSGTGKSTIAARLLAQVPNLTLSISTTTRAPRGQEQDGVHYFFVSEAVFQSMIRQGDFLEYASVFGKHSYGTSKSWVETQLNNDRHVLFDIDVQGAMALKRIYRDQCLTIFIQPPSLEELERRLRLRGTEDEEAIQKRLSFARYELGHLEFYDFAVINHDLDQVTGAILGWLHSKGIATSSATGAV